MDSGGDGKPDSTEQPIESWFRRLEDMMCTIGVKVDHLTSKVDYLTSEIKDIKTTIDTFNTTHDSNADGNSENANVADNSSQGDVSSVSAESIELEDITMQDNTDKDQLPTLAEDTELDSTGDTDPHGNKPCHFVRIPCLEDEVQKLSFSHSESSPSTDSSDCEYIVVRDKISTHEYAYDRHSRKTTDGKMHEDLTMPDATDLADDSTSWRSTSESVESDNSGYVHIRGGNSNPATTVDGKDHYTPFVSSLPPITILSNPKDGTSGNESEGDNIKSGPGTPVYLQEDKQVSNSVHITGLVPDGISVNIKNIDQCLPEGTVEVNSNEQHNVVATPNGDEIHMATKISTRTFVDPSMESTSQMNVDRGQTDYAVSSPMWTEADEAVNDAALDQSEDTPSDTVQVHQDDSALARQINNDHDDQVETLGYPNKTDANSNMKSQTLDMINTKRGDEMATKSPNYNTFPQDKSEYVVGKDGVSRVMEYIEMKPIVFAEIDDQNFHMDNGNDTVSADSGVLLSLVDRNNGQVCIEGSEKEVLNRAIDKHIGDQTSDKEPRQICPTVNDVHLSTNSDIITNIDKQKYNTVLCNAETCDDVDDDDDDDDVKKVYTSNPVISNAHMRDDDDDDREYIPAISNASTRDDDDDGDDDGEYDPAISNAPTRDNDDGDDDDDREYDPAISNAPIRDANTNGGDIVERESYQAISNSPTRDYDDDGEEGEREYYPALSIVPARDDNDDDTDVGRGGSAASTLDAPISHAAMTNIKVSTSKTPDIDTKVHNSFSSVSHDREPHQRAFPPERFKRRKTDPLDDNREAYFSIERDDGSVKTDFKTAQCHDDHNYVLKTPTYRAPVIERKFEEHDVHVAGPSHLCSDNDSDTSTVACNPQDSGPRDHVTLSDEDEDSNVAGDGVLDGCENVHGQLNIQVEELPLINVQGNVAANVDEYRPLIDETQGSVEIGEDKQAKEQRITDTIYLRDDHSFYPPSSYGDMSNRTESIHEDGHQNAGSLNVGESLESMVSNAFRERQNTGGYTTLGVGTNVASFPFGARVIISDAWTGDESRRHILGTVISDSKKGKVKVLWDDGVEDQYDRGEHGSTFVTHIDAPQPLVDSISLRLGSRVIRGPHWKWEEQDGGSENVGIVCKIEAKPKGTIAHVIWPHCGIGNYRFGFRGKYDINICPQWVYQKTPTVWAPYSDDASRIIEDAYEGQVHSIIQVVMNNSQHEVDVKNMLARDVNEVSIIYHIRRVGNLL